MSKSVQMSSTNEENEIQKSFKINWDRYSRKYNNLAEKMEKNGIDTGLLDEVIELKNNLTKANIIIKLDNLFKI